MSLTIDFDRIDAEGPHRFQETLRFEPSEVEGEGFDHPVEANIDVNAAKGDVPGEYLVSGEIEFKTSLDCVRCLEPLEFAEDTKFAVRYAPRPEDRPEHHDLEISQGDLDLDYYAERHVNLEEIIAEQIDLALPMKALCEEACPGLCPRCGARLGSENCDCKEEEIDPRWEALRKIRETLK